MRTLPLDLHILGTPPAFILSQDQTLQKRCLCPRSIFIQNILIYSENELDVDLHYSVFNERFRTNPLLKANGYCYSYVSFVETSKQNTLKATPIITLLRRLSQRGFCLGTYDQVDFISYFFHYIARRLFNKLDLSDSEVYRSYMNCQHNAFSRCIG